MLRQRLVFVRVQAYMLRQRPRCLNTARPTARSIWSPPLRINGITEVPFFFTRPAVLVSPQLFLLVFGLPLISNPEHGSVDENLFKYLALNTKLFSGPELHSFDAVHREYLDFAPLTCVLCKVSQPLQSDVAAYYTRTQLF